MWTLVLLLAVHYVADFLLQSENMGTLKSSSIKWLSIHVAIYAACFIPFGLKFVVVTFVLHWITDFFTSKLTTFFWKRKQYRAFFKIIGLDQLIHVVSLASAYHYLHL